MPWGIRSGRFKLFRTFRGRLFLGHEQSLLALFAGSGLFGLPEFRLRGRSGLVNRRFVAQLLETLRPGTRR